MAKKRDFTGGYKTYDPEADGYGSSWDWKKSFNQRMSKEDAEDVLGVDDPYYILKIKRSATSAEIKKAYYKLAMIYHPDKNPGDVENAKAMMQKINAAYSILVK